MNKDILTFQNNFFNFVKKHIRRITSVLILVVVGVNIFTLSSIRYDIIETSDKTTDKQFANISKTVIDMYNFVGANDNINDATNIESNSVEVINNPQYQAISDFLDLVSTMDNVTTYCYNLDDTATILSYRDYYYQTFLDSIKPQKGQLFGEFSFNAFGENGELNGLKRCFWIRCQNNNFICVYMFDNNHIAGELYNKYNIFLLVINMVISIILCIYVSIIIVKYIPYEVKRKDHKSVA